MDGIELAIYTIIRKELLVDPQVFVYEPGQDTSGLAPADREMLSLAKDDQGWRVKVFVPAHSYVSKPEIDYTNFSEDNKIRVPVMKLKQVEVGPRIVKCPLAIVNYQPDIERTCKDVLTLLMEEGVYVLHPEKFR